MVVSVECLLNFRLCVTSLAVFPIHNAEKQNVRTGAGLLKLDETARVGNNTRLREKTYIKRTIKTYQHSAFLGGTIAIVSKILNMCTF